jgi:alpha-beta hydrolase superfamily lysophospholipase
MAGAPSSRPPIVLIHGLWVNGRSWEEWVEHYAAAGYEVQAPSWPGLEGDPAELRRHPTYGGVGIGEVTDFYAELAGRLSRPPIVIGHSYGGLVTQLLVDRGVVAAGVAVHSAPTQGVVLPLSTIRATSPALRHPSSYRGTVLLSKKQWHWRFCSTFTKEQSDALYERYCIPAPGRPLYQSAMSFFQRNPVIKVDLKNADRPPLLFVATDKADNVVPGRMNVSNAKRYKAGKTDFKEFPGRPHLVSSAPGWEEIADYAAEWGAANAAPMPVSGG